MAKVGTSIAPWPPMVKPAPLAPGQNAVDLSLKPDLWADTAISALTVNQNQARSNS